MMTTLEVSEEEHRLLSRYRDANDHGFAEIIVTIHDHHITDIIVSKKEHFRIPPTKLREVLP